jgi:hypothetical protein
MINRLNKKIQDYYFLKNHKEKLNATILNSLFRNEFDQTWSSNDPYRTMNLGSREFTVSPIEEGILFAKGFKDDGSVNYKYNDDWFRSDNFNKDKNSKFHLLFSGDSETEGIGGNIEDSWAKIMHTNLSKIYDVGNFYNLGRAGSGWHQCILNFFVYEKKYGTPTHFFVLLPNIGRKFLWSENNYSGWDYFQRYVNNENYFQAISDGYIISISMDEQKNDLIDFMISWKIFEEYCDSKNIKLLVSSWDLMELENICLMGQNKSVFKMNKLDAENFFIKNKETLSLQKRDKHKGRSFHEWWAHEFEKEAEKRWGQW